MYSFRTSRNYTALKLQFEGEPCRTALERAEITQLSNPLGKNSDTLDALERAEITQLSNSIDCKCLVASCFRTSRNYTALKLVLSFVLFNIGFRTSRNYTALKQPIYAREYNDSFRTSRNYTALKLDRL